MSMTANDSTAGDTVDTIDVQDFLTADHGSALVLDPAGTRQHVLIAPRFTLPA
jgi:hypothetical protein